MLEDALAGDQLIAMAVLEPGWETDYDSRPPIAPLRLPGQGRGPSSPGRRPLQPAAAGRRARAHRRRNSSRCARSARRRSSCVEDCYDFDSPAERKQLQERLLAAFRKHLPCACQLPEQLEEHAFAANLPLGLLTDLAAYALPLDAE